MCNKIPRVSPYYFKKRSIDFFLPQICSQQILNFRNFTYNINFIKPKNKKKTLKFYYPDSYLYYKLSKRNNITALKSECTGFFKQESLDYIFSDLGVASIKYRMYFKAISFMLNSKKDLDFEKILFFDQLSLKGFDLKIKSFFPPRS